MKLHPQYPTSWINKMSNPRIQTYTKVPDWYDYGRSYQYRLVFLNKSSDMHLTDDFRRFLPKKIAAAEKRQDDGYKKKGTSGWVIRAGCRAWPSLVHMKAHYQERWSHDTVFQNRYLPRIQEIIASIGDFVKKKKLKMLMWEYDAAEAKALNAKEKKLVKQAKKKPVKKTVKKVVRKAAKKKVKARKRK